MKKVLALILALIFAVSLCACNNGKNEQNKSDDNELPSNESASKAFPDDFSFALTWNVYGISSYDSETGKLVKTSDTANPEDYTTYCRLSDKDMEYVYNLIASLDVYSYPDVYDPQDGFFEPCDRLILTVRVNGEIKTIKAEHISDFKPANDEKGQLFIDTCEAIYDLLELTEEWMALPDYPTLYE